MDSVAGEPNVTRRVFFLEEGHGRALSRRPRTSLTAGREDQSDQLDLNAPDPNLLPSH